MAESETQQAVTEQESELGFAPKTHDVDGERNGLLNNGPPSEDPIEAARAAGLRYVSDEEPGLYRHRRGKGWSYHEPDGTLIRDLDVRERIDALAIPPAWTEVWICPHANGHLQATGRDDRGRKQYRYHPRWTEIRNATKFNRMIRFGDALPRIRARVEEDLRRNGIPREKVLAAVVRLLETTCIRVGNEEYKRKNSTFGLTTLRDRHVEFRGSEVRFRFNGKGGKERDVSVNDPQLASIVRECRDIPGYELFQYYDEDGEKRALGSGEVNAYLKEISDGDFTAKDFRTWIGSLHAFTYLRELGEAGSEKEVDQNWLAAVDYVADHLRNTRAVCRQFYIHPAVLERYRNGGLGVRAEDREEAEWLDEAELALLSLLRDLETCADPDHCD